MKSLRLGLGLIAAVLFVAVCGPWRRLAQRMGLSFGRGLPVAFSQLLCLVLRIRVRRVGEPSAGPARLIVANHVSWLDIPILAGMEPMTFLAKRQVGTTLLGRQLAALQGVVYVDRERKRCIPQVNAHIGRVLAAGGPVVLFAEATTSDGNRLLRFRSSHFAPLHGLGHDACVQPVYLNYARLGDVPVTRSDRPVFAWYGDMAFFPSLWRVFGAGALTCEVHYGEPLPAAEHRDRKALARETERAVRRLARRAREEEWPGARAGLAPRRVRPVSS